MPTKTPTCRATQSAHSLDLPPPFRLVTLREAGDAFAHAAAIAAVAGAGTLVQVGRFDTAEFALVLEPEQPLQLARRALNIGLCALGDALVARVPPKRTIGFDWPDAIRVDGAPVGRARLGWPAGADESKRPEWLVFGATIRMAAMEDAELGLQPSATTLEDEGFDDASSEHLIERFARHLMARIANCREQGFDAIAKSYYGARLLPEKAALFDIDENGDPLAWRTGACAPERRSLPDALTGPSPDRSCRMTPLRDNRPDPDAAGFRLEHQQ
jgi:biotin/lipoate A/B protein ligase family protein